MKLCKTDVLFVVRVVAIHQPTIDEQSLFAAALERGFHQSPLLHKVLLTSSHSSADAFCCDFTRASFVILRDHTVPHFHVLFQLYLLLHEVFCYFLLLLVPLFSLTTQPPALHTSGHHANNGQPMFDNGRIVRWIDFCPSAKLRLGRGNYVKEEKG